MQISDTTLLACPETGQALQWAGTNLELALADGWLSTADGSHRWSVSDGLPCMLREDWLRGTDRLSRHIHEHLPRMHRPMLRLALPLLQGGGSEGSLRAATLEALCLGELGPRSDRPARLLELGIGEGAFVSLIRAALPGGLRAEHWGVDLSSSLLCRCRELGRHNSPREQPRLVLADAHRLPFADATFDRAFHVGGLGRFDDPAAVLTELARVTVHGGRIVVVGKRLDRRESPAPPVLWAYRLLTMHEPEVDLDSLILPPGVDAVRIEQISRFFCCLSMTRIAVP